MSMIPRICTLLVLSCIPGAGCVLIDPPAAGPSAIVGNHCIHRIVHPLEDHVHAFEVALQGSVGHRRPVSRDTSLPTQ